MSYHDTYLAHGASETWEDGAGRRNKLLSDKIRPQTETWHSLRFGGKYAGTLSCYYQQDFAYFCIHSLGGNANYPADDEWNTVVRLTFLKILDRWSQALYRVVLN